MSLQAAAAAMGVPEILVQRSAEARAKATGQSVDDILAAWAGGEAAPAAAPAPTAEPAPAPEPAAAEPAPEPTPAPAAAPEPAAAAGVVTPIAPPSEVSPEEALDYPVVVSVPTLGITERTSTSLPRWLAIAFFIIPAFGLLQLAGGDAASAECSDTDVLLSADFITGALENCDGSEFEGRAGGGDGPALYLAIGQTEYATCAGCHGANGGGGVGPAFGAVNATFSSCLDHVEWVRLGTNGFREAGIDTYGDLAKPVGGGGVMPGFSALSEEQLASVVAFERIRFGGADPDQTMVDCGLIAPPDGEEGAEPAEGGAEAAAVTGARG